MPPALPALNRSRTHVPLRDATTAGPVRHGLANGSRPREASAISEITPIGTATVEPVGCGIPAASSQTGNDDFPNRRCQSTESRCRSRAQHDPRPPVGGRPGVHGYGRALHTRALRIMARGTVAAPSIHVKTKAGLNREILATHWSQPEPWLDSTCQSSATIRPMWTGLRPCSQGQPAGTGGVGVRGPVSSGRMPTIMRRSTAWPVGRHRPVRPVGQGSLHDERRFRQGPQRSVNTMFRNCFNLVDTDVCSLSTGWAPLRPSHAVPTVLATSGTACSSPVASRAKINECETVPDV